jgi:hypothetical protein
MFISIDHIPDMRIYVAKELPTRPTIINLNHVINFEPMLVYPLGEKTEITKISTSNHTYIYLPFTFEETLAIIRNATNVRDFRVGIGDYYVEVKKYLTPSDIDKSQLAELGR